jgi:hypothetical protein
MVPPQVRDFGYPNQKLRRSVLRAESEAVFRYRELLLPLIAIALDCPDGLFDIIGDGGELALD